VPKPTTDDPFVLGGTPSLLPRRTQLIAVAMVLAVIAVPVRGLFVATGSSMEEGFMLVFPKRLLAGDVPNVDFLHLYGPFSLHVLAGWYTVFGDTISGLSVVHELGVGDVIESVTIENANQ